MEPHPLGPLATASDAGSGLFMLDKEAGCYWPARKGVVGDSVMAFGGVHQGGQVKGMRNAREVFLLPQVGPQKEYILYRISSHREDKFEWTSSLPYGAQSGCCAQKKLLL